VLFRRAQKVIPSIRVKADPEAVPQHGRSESNIEIIALDQHPIECFHSRGAKDFDDDEWPMAIDGLPTSFYDGILVALDVDLHQCNRRRPEGLCPVVECPSDDRMFAVFADLPSVLELEGRAGRDQAVVIDRLENGKRPLA
jgi:hypothetical protein